MIDFSTNTDADSNAGIKHTKLIKPKSTHKYLPIIIAASVLAVTIIAIIITITSLSHPTIDDNFFTSDDTKTTIPLTPSGDDTKTTSLTKTYLVYDYDDNDNVISMKTYFEYPDAETAKTAYESVKDQPEFKGAKVQDKYIIVTADESQYKGLTAYDIKQQADALKAFEESQHPTTDKSSDSESEESEEE